MSMICAGCEVSTSKIPFGALRDVGQPFLDQPLIVRADIAEQEQFKLPLKRNGREVQYTWSTP